MREANWLPGRWLLQVGSDLFMCMNDAIHRHSPQWTPPFQPTYRHSFLFGIAQSVIQGLIIALLPILPTSTFRYNLIPIVAVERMRQRNVIHDDEAAPTQPIARRVAAVDIFPKPKEDFQRVQTRAGGVVSAVTIGLIVILLLWETVGYACGWDAYTTDLSMDRNPNRTMEVNVDITFPQSSCLQLSVDIRDIAGTRRINVTRSLQKIPLDYNGNPAYKGDIVEIEDALAESITEGGAVPCEKCFLLSDRESVSGIRDAKGKLFLDRCCETCQDVMSVYKEAGLDAPRENRVPQCVSEVARRNPGCRVVGTLRLKKIPGTLVFAPKQVNANYRMDDVLQFRSNHRINKFSLGSTRVNRFSKLQASSQLQGREFRSPYLYEVRYFLNVVPTTYNTKERQPDNLRTYEYAVMYSERPVHLNLDGLIPAVMFGFDFSPMQINNYFVRPPLAKFLTKLCGIVGGLFVILGVVDRVVAHVMHLV